MLEEVRIPTSNGLLQIPIAGDSFNHLDVSQDGRNVNNIRLFFFSWVNLLADSSKLEGNHTYKPARVIRKFVADFLSRPLRDTLTFYTGLAHSIVSTTTTYGDDLPRGDFVHDMRHTPVFWEYCRWYKTGDVQLIRYLYTFLNFGKKLEIDDPSLKADAFRVWLDVEKRLSERLLDDEFVRLQKRIVAKLIPEFDDSVFVPKFGPKAVAEPKVRGTIAKAVSLRFNALIDRAFYQGALPGQTKEGGFLARKTLNSAFWQDTRASDACSIDFALMREVFKSFKSYRLICMEPNTTMYHQQGVRRWFEKAFRTGPMRRFCRLEDQSRNRVLARYGSETGLIDTIDLSNASDSVGTDLVKRIFPTRPLYYMLATRTSKVKTPGGVVRTKKFAPMGSALCFPVQCLVFTSTVIACAVLWRNGYRPGEPMASGSFTDTEIDRTIKSFRTELDPSRSNSSKQLEPLAVFGDDICVDTRLTPYVTHYLTLLGFEVNQAKSFQGGQAFRESCGGYYLGGDDVTPQYYRCGIWSGPLDAPNFMSLVACINHAEARGFKHLRSMLIRYLLRTDIEGIRRRNGVNPILFSDDPENPLGIFSKEPRNGHVRTRNRERFQRTELRTITTRARSKVAPTTSQMPFVEKYGLLQWWVGDHSDTDPVTKTLAYAGDNLPGKPVHPDRSDAVGSRLVLGWTPAPV